MLRDRQVLPSGTNGKSRRNLSQSRLFSSKSLLARRKARSTLLAKEKYLLTAQPADKLARSTKWYRQQSLYLIEGLGTPQSLSTSVISSKCGESISKDCSADVPDGVIRRHPVTRLASDAYVPLRSPKRKRRNRSHPITSAYKKKAKPCVSYPLRNAWLQRGPDPKSTQVASTQLRKRSDSKRPSEHKLHTASFLGHQQRLDPSAPENVRDVPYGLAQSLDPFRASPGFVHNTNPSTGDTSNDKAAATSSSERTTASKRSSANSQGLVNNQAAASGNGDGADDPDDPNRRGKLSRSHETELPNEGERLMPDSSPQPDDGTVLQLEEDRNSGNGKQREGREGRKESNSVSSDNENERSTTKRDETSEAAPAQTSRSTTRNEDEEDSGDSSAPLADHHGLEWALIQRCRMVRASDITGEPTAHAEWLHYLRPTALLARGKGHEGYGGYGTLASLPDADRPNTVENQRNASRTPTEDRTPGVTEHELATERGSIRLTSSPSVVYPRADLTEIPARVIDVTRVPQDQSSVQAPVQTGTQSLANIEHSQPQVLSPLQTPPQALSGSASARRDEPPVYETSHIGERPYEALTGSRRTQGRSWASVLCCIGNRDRSGRSSMELESSSSENESSSPLKLRSTNQVHEISGTRPTEAQSNSPSHHRAAAERQSDTQGSTPGHNLIATDSLVLPQVLVSTDSGTLITIDLKPARCPRPRFAAKNARWRDPTPRD